MARSLRRVRSMDSNGMRVGDVGGLDGRPSELLQVLRELGLVDLAVDVDQHRPDVGAEQIRLWMRSSNPRDSCLGEGQSQIPRQQRARWSQRQTDLPTCRGVAPSSSRPCSGLLEDIASVTFPGICEDPAVRLAPLSPALASVALGHRHLPTQRRASPARKSAARGFAIIVESIMNIVTLKLRPRSAGGD